MKKNKLIENYWKEFNKLSYENKFKVMYYNLGDFFDEFIQKTDKDILQTDIDVMKRLQKGVESGMERVL